MTVPANTRIWNVVIDTSSDDLNNFGCIMLGTADSGYGENSVDGMKNIIISNVISNSSEAIVVGGYISDSVISNVINCNEECLCISVRRENGLINVQTANLCSSGKDLIKQTETTKDYPI